MARKREDRESGSKQKRHLQRLSKRSNQEISKGIDIDILKSQLSKLDLMLREVPGDGNCLFRALGDQLEGHMGNHYRLRQDTTSYMLEHKEDFQPFVEDDVPFDKHISELSQLGTYAGNDAIVAFARLHKVVIVIHQPDAPVWQIKGWETTETAHDNITPRKSKAKQSSSYCQKVVRQLHIAYHGGDHYDSVRKIGDTSHLPTSIVLNIESSDESNKRSPLWQFEEECFDRLQTEAVNLLEDANDLEIQAMERSGCKDLQMVRELLYSNCGNLDAAVEDLLAICSKQVFETNSDLKAPTEEFQSKGRGNLNKKQLEKIRKYERKRANENRKKHKSTNVTDETVIVSRVQCLNI